MFLNHPILSRRLRNREFREVPGMPMIVFNNVLCFVILPDLPSLSGDSASANSAEFRMVPGMPMIVFNNVLCFVILPSLPGDSSSNREFRGIPRDTGNLDDSLSKYNLYGNHPIPPQRLCDREFRRIPRVSGNANDSLQ